MDNQELADKIVAFGVGEFKHECYWIAHGGYKAEQFVRDWRVAGALMERCAKENSPDGRTIALSFGVGVFCATRAGSASPTYGVYLERTNESAPRAINEACVEALS